MRLETILAVLEKYSMDVEYASSYGEKGYTDSAVGILIANWNHVPRYIGDALERRGYQLEWYDEWIVIHESGKAYRTQPDSYSWTRYYVVSDDGDIIGGDEIESDETLARWYVDEYLLGDYRKANLFNIDLGAMGFVKLDSEYETGFHPGQNDKPCDVLKRLCAEMPNYEFIFDMVSVGQFDARWCVWARKVED